MRQYKENGQGELLQVQCNCCGKQLAVENGILKEGSFRGEQVFGYFSKKDGTKHGFDLCEDCYDKWIAGFLVPVEEETETELV